MTRFTPLLLAFLVGCPTPTPTPTGSTPLCDPEPAFCPECYDGDVECSYEGVSVTEASCGGCQAEQALFAALCAEGSTSTREEVEAGRTCVGVN